MAYKQNNPLNRNNSPLNNVMNLARGVQKWNDNVNQDPKMDPTFNPENINRHKVVDQYGKSGDEMTGGYEGITDYNSGDGVHSPEGVSAHLYRSGDVYAQNREMQQNMSFNPEEGYSPRMLNIYYDKTEDGRPYSAYIDKSGPGSSRLHGGDLDSRLRESLGKRYNLTNHREKEEFEKARLAMYNNQMNMVNRANAYYKIADPEKYLNYYQDERSGRSSAPRNEDSDFAWKEKMYARDARRQFGSEEPIIIGAPRSDERANYLRMVDERYNNQR